MKIFDRYLLLNFLKILAVVSLVSVGLIVMYSLTDFFLGFKVTDFKAGAEYVIYLIPVGFYILSSLLVNISLMILFRRLFSKGIDLTVQSFGISPLRFSAFLVVFVSSLSFLFITLNESVLPGLFKKLWYIEKTYKKNQEIGRIVSRLWFVKETELNKYYTYIGSLDVTNGKFTGLFMMTVSKEGSVQEVVEGNVGTWKGNRIYVGSGSSYNFREGYFVRELKDFSLKTEIDVSDVRLFAEEIEHVSSSALLGLYLKGSRLGFDTKRYLSEVIYRAGLSLLPTLVLIPLLRDLFRFRSLKAGMLSFFINLVIGWVVVVSPKLLSEKANLDPQYALLAYILLLIYLLKGVNDLRKGFRV
ncbi:lipopolysaccharide export LptBFGC system permease protein LptF [Hydrogenivirga caldilitoris]|uniref:Lipopolysaccharide export LptBFGC system permease protein LptF n=1 Tax=Hydrogenivirga caldilitoris TaxID=246264 RepID=A0A497XPS6_9AQUI|nr:LptF/LptG family permease [Hydrogenivirga caldilitoris]RLJ70281.1 lipopolysaccharide export LptBFGC system permease protein LptF [Hydrogenivirga caldilitoris]